jgi:hypothetical protein
MKGNDSMKTNQLQAHENGGVYEIKIKGILDDHWNQWFEGMTMKRVENGEIGQMCTLITGPIADQPALHGLLAKIRDLNLTLISVYRINFETNDREETAIDFPSGVMPEKRADETENGSMKDFINRDVHE